MKEHSILFPAPMVRATLEGRMTMTRRAIKPQPEYHAGAGFFWRGCYHGLGGSLDPHGLGNLAEACPYGQPGDRLWVRESARVINVRGGSREIDIEYQADKLFATVPYPERLAPAPKGKLLANGTYREASRILLEITAVRVERVQDISEDNAKAEGLSEITKDGHLFKYGIPDRDGLPGTDNDGWPWSEWNADPRKAFCALWDSINAKRGYGWGANPWVWVIEFKALAHKSTGGKA